LAKPGEQEVLHQTGLDPDSSGRFRSGRQATLPARIGRYEIIERIGAGGMAEAFRAKARGPAGYERELIIKSILPELAEDAEFIRLFVAEAKILGLIKHPNVVQVYDFGEEGGRHFLALEYLDGPSVADMIAVLAHSGQNMPLGLAVYIAREICLGLAAAHGLCGPDDRPLNVVHRDVTPSNVMTTTVGEVKLVDFGIVRVGPATTATLGGRVRGKPAYLSPEQLAGNEIDGRTDLFTAGIVLHEMLTLKPLFLAENELATIYRIMMHQIVPPSVPRSDVPPELDRIVLRALEREPEQRYQTADEMAADLTELVNQLGVHREDLAEFARQIKQLSGELRPSARLRIASSVPPNVVRLLDETPVSPFDPNPDPDDTPDTQ